MADKAMTEKDLAVTTVLGVEPLTVETRPAGLAADPTPTEAVFIRNNLGPPAADGPWTVELTGTVSEARLSLEDVFGSLPRHDITMVLQCAGNGRSRLPEPVPGVQWERGAMACVEWSGVLLAYLVAAYGGPAEDFAYVTVLGGDAPADDPSRVERSIPAHAALADGLLADRMNGGPLPTIHGGPIRFVMPGYYAVNSVKWVRRLAFTHRESDADIQQRRYRLVPPGEDPGPQHRPVWEMGPVSHILEVHPGTDAVTVEGVAFSGGDPIEAVEVTTDGETWQEAELEPAQSRFAWRRFRANLPAGTGWAAARCRTDRGVQPRHTTPNRDGYAIDGWQELSVRLEV